MTIVLTQAWNAERTLPRTIESVLAQENADFAYHILDSASTDDTRRIILNAAAKDARVFPVMCRENKLQNYMSYIERLLRDTSYGDRDTLTIVDADDELLPGALELMKEAVDGDHSDVVVGGVRFFKDDGTTDSLWIKDMHLPKSDLPGIFRYLRGFLCPSWEKLYTLGLLRKTDFTQAKAMRYSGDAVFVTEAFRHVKSVSFRSQPVIHYHHSAGQVTKKFDPLRYDAAEAVFCAMLRFLDEIGPVSFDNRMCLYRFYFKEIVSFLETADYADLPKEEKRYWANLALMAPRLRETLACNEITDGEWRYFHDLCNTMRA
ncbi:MAG: glycosyltransferase [Oscillospiraceae bacterium]|jgi:glycosyltransferase involved in cell wall biosynthesis|nr:glycosyltransferase [Oscillospiraceae bacterium]